MSTLLKKHSFQETFDSQKAFRVMLEAMSNPTRVVSIKEYADKMFGSCSGFLAIAMTLLDNEVSFHTCENGELSNEIITLTLAKPAEISTADFVFMCNPADLKTVMKHVKCGDLINPHKSAVLIIKDDNDHCCNITFQGPGIDQELTAPVSESALMALKLRDEQEYEYPQGIDLMFLTDGGDLYAIPRLVRWEVR